MSDHIEQRREKIRKLKDELFGDMLTTAEVAAILEVHPRTVGDYIRDGRLRGVQLGGGWRIPESSLREFVAELTLSSPAPKGEGGGIFRRFGEASRDVVRRAADEARALKHSYIGTEHLLLALLAEQSSTAGAFREEGITYELAKERVIEMISFGNSVLEGMLPFTPRSKKVLELSLRTALRFSHNEIRPEHLALALMQESDGVAAQVVAHLGSADAVIERLRGLLNG